MKKILNKLIDRWKQDSPILYKKLTNICVVIGAIGTGLLTIDGLPSIVHIVCPYLIAISTIGGILSKLTVDNNSN